MDNETTCPIWKIIICSSPLTLKIVFEQTSSYEISCVFRVVTRILPAVPWFCYAFAASQDRWRVSRVNTL